MGEQAGVGEAGMVHTHARQRVSAGHGAWSMEHGSMAAWGMAEHGHARTPGQSTRMPGQDHFGLQDTKRGTQSTWCPVLAQAKDVSLRLGTAKLTKFWSARR